MSHRRAERSATGGRALVPLLGALTALGPATIDAYLPALPTISRELPGTRSIPVQLTLAASLLGLAVGQLAAGIISDRFGNRRPLVIGMLAYALCSLLCAAAPSAAVLLAARLITGATGASGIAIARAIAADLSTGEQESARLLSLLMGIAGVAPIAAPLVGGGLLALAGWRAIFLALGAVGALCASAAS